MKPIDKRQVFAIAGSIGIVVVALVAIRTATRRRVVDLENAGLRIKVSDPRA